MQIAIMQPYFLPYIGYFQLMATVDKFVVLDDACFKKKGWINRNRILLNGKPHTFTIPLRGASQNLRICDLELAQESLWREKLLKTIQQAYCKAPCFTEVFELIVKIVNFPSRNLDAFLLNSLYEVTNLLKLDVKIIKSSRIYGNANLKAEERILNICKREGATEYVNAIGGANLYDKATFAKEGIHLSFIESRPNEYKQYNAPHVSSLSILDVLMFNNVQRVRQLLCQKEPG